MVLRTTNMIFSGVFASRTGEYLTSRRKINLHSNCIDKMENNRKGIKKKYSKLKIKLRNILKVDCLR